MIKLEFSETSIQPFWIVDKTVHIGSGAENQLVINDPSLSAQHASISLQNGNYVLKDLGSQTGTFIKGQRISQRRIRNQDTIRLGNTSLQVIDAFDSANNNGTWSLISCSRHIAGREFPLQLKPGQTSIKVGRGRHCDVIFPEAYLSREHAELAPEGDQLRVTDLGSASGTYINDQRITSSLAKPGDRIRLDIYNFVLVGPVKSSPDSRETPAPEVPAPQAMQCESVASSAERDAYSGVSQLPIVIAGVVVSLIVAGLYFLG